MKHEDTINLLKECNAGVKMGVDSIDDVLGYVQNENLKQMLNCMPARYHADLPEKNGFSQ